MTLFFYVLRDFFRFVFGTLLLVLFLFVLFDFLHKTTRYIPRYNPEALVLIRYYIYQLPSLLVQALPIASLLSSVISMVLLSRSNEITAMRAAGMSSIQISLPLFIGGGLLSVCSIALGEWIQPYTSSRMHYVQEIEIEKLNEGPLVEGVRWLRSGSMLYNFRDFDPSVSRIYGLKVIELGPSFRPQKMMESSFADFDPIEKLWRLDKVKVKFFWPNGTISYSENKAELWLDIPLEPRQLERDRRENSEMSVIELYRLVEKGRRSGVDTLDLQVDMHVKLAFHFASLVVCLMGLKFGYKSERVSETAKGVLIAIGIGVSYWFVLNSGRALAKRGSLPPLIGSWVANVVIMAIAAYSAFKSRRP